MKWFPTLASCLVALSFASCTANDNITRSQLADQSLPAGFQPPQVFRNVNLVRTINLEKGYPRETINVVIENVDKQAQDEYYLPLDPSLAAHVGAIEARDKKDAGKPAFEVSALDTDRLVTVFKMTSGSN